MRTSGCSACNGRPANLLFCHNCIDIVRSEKRQSVYLALTDLCRFGGISFDVGTNVGDLSVAMSRLVEPQGCVYSFEASPRILAECQRNLNENGCGNAQIIHRAVYSRSGETIKIYSQREFNDTIMASSAPQSTGYATVKTVALDDFCAVLNAYPEVIKFDIEEAEYDALLGMPELLKVRKPHLILEQQTNDARCLELLGAACYDAIDLANYREIKSLADYLKGATLRNVLFIHRETIRRALTPDLFR